MKPRTDWIRLSTLSFRVDRGINADGSESTSNYLEQIFGLIIAEIATET